MAKNESNVEKRVEGVERTLSKFERFIETYQKQIVWVVTVIFAIAIVGWMFNHYYLSKRAVDAAEQMFPAEKAFEAQDWQLAIDGDGNNPGFLEIIDDYPLTPSARLAKYYAGMSYLKLGQFEDAIKYLSKFSSDDMILSSLALGGIADAHAELGNNDKAVSFYRKAAKANPNEFTSPFYLMRAGILLEQQKDFKQASEVYEIIRKEYPTSTEGRNISKYITRVAVEQQNQDGNK